MERRSAWLAASTRRGFLPPLDLPPLDLFLAKRARRRGGRRAEEREVLGLVGTCDGWERPRRDETQRKEEDRWDGEKQQRQHVRREEDP
ncbi:unnamed protein product [Urochloa humidicola]